jgi:NDP-sugar pyrophosphorylase family protein
MVEVGGVPILAYQIAWLKASGVDRFIISCGYRHDVIQDYFGDGAGYGVHIEYAIEREKLGTGGGLKLAFGFADTTDPFVLGTNGDILTNLSLASLIDTHKADENLATISLTQLQSPYGIVDSDEANKVTAFHEKPLLPFWLSAGIYVLSPAVRGLLPDVGDHERSTFPSIAQDGKLGAYKAEAYWRAIDTAKDLSEAESELEEHPLPHV